jgi:chromosome segregation ATPase
MAHMDDVIRRVGQCEGEITNLKIKLAENSVNMNNIREIIGDFKEFMTDTRSYMQEHTKVLQGIEYKMEAFTESQNCLKEEVTKLKDKVEGNEESHKLDTRALFKKIIEKLFIAIGCAAIIGGIIYWVSTL